MDPSISIFYHYNTTNIIKRDHMSQGCTISQRRISFATYENFLAQIGLCTGFVVSLQAVYRDPQREWLILGKSHSVSITEVLPFCK